MKNNDRLAQLRTALLKIEVMPPRNGKTPRAEWRDRGVEWKMLWLGQGIQNELVTLPYAARLRLVPLPYRKGFRHPGGALPRKNLCLQTWPLVRRDSH
jgi:hypothetical protein